MCEPGEVDAGTIQVTSRTPADSSTAPKRPKESAARRLMRPSASPGASTATWSNDPPRAT